jgi:Zn-dependent M28 family amino/carboxypeptidase
MAKEEPPAVLITDAGREHGLLNAGSGGPRDPKAPESFPAVTMAHEHYALLYRLAKRGAGVRLEMEVRNQFEDEDTKAYNTVAEIRGSERPDEVVILGAHLDSWDLGQGATDNGAGSMAVLEAARLLKAVGAKPKRTIRFILFGGEEQGLLGSRAYVQAHDGEMRKVSGVFVLDTGTGRVRGIGTEGNERVIPIFQSLLAPFKEMGVLWVNPRIQIGTDHISFKSKGVPGFAFFQDAIEYRDKTHHTQTDTFDKILPDDMTQAATVMAATAYNVAQLPGLLPRK